jgi:hypothetical protein
MVKAAVFDAIEKAKQLGTAVAWLVSRPMLGSQNYALTGPVQSGHTQSLGEQPKPVIPVVSGGVGSVAKYSEPKVNEEVDDFIKNLANDPRNLYYRNQSTGDNGGTQLDKPTGQGNVPLVNEILRLVSYHNYLKNTIGLNL